MSVINLAVAWALSIASDNTHGYDQGSRWGPDYDCSSFVIQAYDQAGIPVKSNGASYTGDMIAAFKKTGFIDVTSSINLSTGAGLIKGDVVWKSGHCEMVSSPGYLVGAHINEHGETTGGTTGDQTGKEIYERTYYNSPWTTVLRYPESSESYISKNAYLSVTEMQINARYIYEFFSAYGWSLNAIAGMLGNMQVESTINPGIWQNLDSGNTDLGYGLVQWTPATKILNYLSTMGYEQGDINGQCMRIIYEMENGIQWISTPAYMMTFKDFSKSTQSPEYLAYVFLNNYERPENRNQPIRQTNARYWYNFLSGNVEPIKNKKDKFNWIVFNGRRRRNGV